MLIIQTGHYIELDTFMADKSWMLNPKAIRHANECINLIRRTTGRKLKLSQPDFLVELHKSVETIQSRELGTHYGHLLSMSGVGNLMKSLAEPAQAVVAAPQVVGEMFSKEESETVEIDGKLYPKFRNGRQIDGVIYGIPRYRRAAR